jgi:hypothetical protein
MGQKNDQPSSLDMSLEWEDSTNNLMSLREAAKATEIVAGPELTIDWVPNLQTLLDGAGQATPKVY